MEQRLIDANKICCMDCEECHENDICDTYNAPTVLTIPENPTNGDMQLVLCPELEVRNFGSFVEAHSPNVEMRVSKSWWNAPFKRGNEDGK